LEERSRRPHFQPHKTESALEQRIIELRQKHPAWGGRKLRRRLLDLGFDQIPAASTITEILRRHDLLDPHHPSAQGPWQRFDHPSPNDLWQMDFKAPLPTVRNGLCYPLTLLDDHSRFSLAIAPCVDQRLGTVQRALQQVMERYGLPQAILCDNGIPWHGADPACSFSALSVWLLRVGVDVWHGRPYHPQTQGKEERFHRTFGLELLDRTTAWLDHQHCGQEFERFRDCYNLERPHQALQLAVPASRYRPSARLFPAQLPQAQYLAEDQVRLVRAKGEVKFQGKLYYIGQAFGGLCIAFRPTRQDGCFELFFSWKKIGFLDLHDPLIQNTSRPALCRPGGHLQRADAIFGPSLSPQAGTKNRALNPHLPGVSLDLSYHLPDPKKR
jgi:transposase InsO family protein